MASIAVSKTVDRGSSPCSPAKVEFVGSVATLTLNLHICWISSAGRAVAL